MVWILEMFGLVKIIHLFRYAYLISKHDLLITKPVPKISHVQKVDKRNNRSKRDNASRSSSADDRECQPAELFNYTIFHLNNWVTSGKYHRATRKSKEYEKKKKTRLDRNHAVFHIPRELTHNKKKKIAPRLGIDHN